MAEEGFYDSNHLLPDGATGCTERLGREVVLPVLREDQAAETR